MEKILKSKPKDLPLLLRLAKLKEKQEDFEGALEAYKKILDISPDHEESQEIEPFIVFRDDEDRSH